MRRAVLPSQIWVTSSFSTSIVGPHSWMTSRIGSRMPSSVKMSAYMKGESGVAHPVSIRIAALLDVGELSPKFGSNMSICRERTPKNLTFNSCLLHTRSKLPTFGVLHMPFPQQTQIEDGTDYSAMTRCWLI